MKIKFYVATNTTDTIELIGISDYCIIPTKKQFISKQEISIKN